MADFQTGVGAATLQLSVQEVAVNTAGNYSTVNWQLYLICGNGASFNNNPVGWSVSIGGIPGSGTYTFDFRSTSTVLVASGSVNINHDSAGNATISVSGHTDATGASAIGGPADVSGSVTLTHISRTPSAPRNLAATATGGHVVVTFIGPADIGSSAIINYTIQYSLNGGAWTGTVSNVSGSQPFDLASGSYRFRVWANNSQGAGAIATSTAIDVHSGGKVRVGGAWKSGLVKVRVDGAWKTAIVKVRVAGAWKNAL